MFKDQTKITVVIENTIVGLELKVNGVAHGSVRTIEPIILRGRGDWTEFNKQTITDLGKLINKTFNVELVKLNSILDSLVAQVKTFNLNERFCIELTVTSDEKPNEGEQL